MDDARQDGIEGPITTSIEGGQPTQAASSAMNMEKDKRSEYLKLLELHNANRIDYNTRKWETLKYFQSIVLALLGATVLALTTGIDKGLFCKPFILSAVFTMVATALPLVAALAARLAIANLDRESALLFAEEAQVFKIAKLLQLDMDVPPQNRWLPADDRLFMPKWQDWTYGLTNVDPTIDFKKWMQLRTKNHRFMGLSNSLFWLEFVFGILSAGLIAALFAIANVGALSTIFGGSLCHVGLAGF